MWVPLLILPHLDGLVRFKASTGCLCSNHHNFPIQFTDRQMCSLLCFNDQHCDGFTFNKITGNNQFIDIIPSGLYILMMFCMDINKALYAMFGGGLLSCACSINFVVQH